MKRYRSVLVAILSAVFLAACATSSYTPEQLTQLDYGPYPDNYKDIVEHWLAGKLKDPKSAIVEYRARPQHVWQKGSLISSQDYGWGVCVWVNEKDSAGGNSGRRSYAFMIRNGSVVQSHEEMGTTMFDSAYAQSMCRHLGTNIS